MAAENSIFYPGDEDAQTNDGVESPHYPELQYPDDHFTDYPSVSNDTIEPLPAVNGHVVHPHPPIDEAKCMHEARALLRHGTEKLMPYHRIVGHEGPLPGQMTGLYHGWSVYLSRTETRLNELLQSVEGDDVAFDTERTALQEARHSVQQCVLQLRPSVHFASRPINNRDRLSPVSEIGLYYEVVAQMIVELEMLYIQCGGALNSGITVIMP